MAVPADSRMVMDAGLRLMSVRRKGEAASRSPMSWRDAP
jgi:hypothetical protein